MKLLFLLFVVAILGAGAYLVSSQKFGTKKGKKRNWKPLGIATCVVIALLALIAYGMYRTSKQPDLHCGNVQKTDSTPPSQLEKAPDYFQQGNYDYDKGNCKQAIVDYSKSIEMDPAFPQAYNNRAYTYMRMRDYKDALPDLDKAIELRPDYIQALMNRGDIHNFYYQIDRKSAVIDYEKVAKIDGTQNTTSVCGHLVLARNNGWRPKTFVQFLTGAWDRCN